MKQICSFPSRIHNLCRLPATRKETARAILFNIFFGVLLFLALLLVLTPLPALIVALAGMLLMLNPMLRMLTTRRQYQPISFEILADDKAFAVIIPQLDIAGYARRQQSVAFPGSVTALEYSASLHCIRLEADFITSVFTLSSKLLSKKPERRSYYFYLNEEDEARVLEALEALLGRKARHMDS